MKSKKKISINILPSEGRPKGTKLVANYDVDNEQSHDVFRHIEALANTNHSSIQEFFILLNERIKNHY